MPGYRYCPRCTAALVVLEGRQACPDRDCGFAFYDNPTPVVAAIVEVPEGIVLARSPGWPAKMLGLPTGYVEPREDPAHAVVREVREELGLEGRIVELVGVYPFAKQNQILIAYHLQASGPVVLGEELESYKIVLLARLQGWNFGTGLAVRAWLDSRSAGAASASESGT